MRIEFGFVCALLALSLAAAKQAPAAESQPKVSSHIGRRIEPFSLRDFRGKTFALQDFQQNKLLVVAFVGTECPLAKLYAARLVKLAEEYAGQGIGVVAINANVQDSISELAHFAKTHAITFPLLKDPGNKVADAFGAKRTPEVFLLDADRVVRYWGRIDDQYGVGFQRDKVSRRDLAVAIDELLAGKPVSEPACESVGCYIGRVTEPDPDCEITYCDQVARILQKRCVECHRAGQIAPFALTSYDEVVGWAETMAEVIEDGRMPPWHANPKYGHFANDARMSDEEKQQIFTWVEAGAPQGDPKKLPEPRKYAEGWRIPQPDLVLYMSKKPFRVPAEGEVRYQYLEVDPGFKEDKWVRAAECRPDNRAVVHHIIAIIRPPGGRGRLGGIKPGWLAATAPGAPPMILPDGMAKRVPAGSTIVFQMHYTPNGSVQYDRSCVGMVFADPKTVRKEVGTRDAVNRRFVIPAGADNYEVRSNRTFHEDTLLLSMFPHMHLRGKSFRYVAHYPDGASEILLDVPHYDFNWQNGYALAEHKLLPAGTKVECVAHFDNSQSNLANPDPTDAVRWGDQTWEEMMIGYFDVALADQDLTKVSTSKSPRTEEFLQQAKTGVKLSDSFRQLARSALDSNEAFQRFGEALRAFAPQLDRACLTTVSDGKLEVAMAVQPVEVRRKAGGAGVVIPARDLALTQYAAGDKTVVNQDLSQSDKRDLQFMRRSFSSSLHIPAKVDGKQATLNFWSAEPEAFPPALVALLEEVGQLVLQEQEP